MHIDKELFSIFRIMELNLNSKFFNLRYSNFKFKICQNLADEGFILSAKKQKGMIQVQLNPSIDYRRFKIFKASLNDLSVTELCRLADVYSFGIVSTSKGLVTLRQAIFLGIGGKILFAFC